MATLIGGSPAMATSGRSRTERRPAAVAPAATDTAPETGGRLDHLDALRGVAAGVVVVHHTLLALTPTDAWADAWNPLNPVLLGRPAVILFFVLSGFVLTLHLNASGARFSGFAVRRFVRLLVPYGAAIGLAVAGFGLTQPHRPTGLSAWFDAQWNGPAGIAVVLRHLALLAGPRQFPLDHVAWSLVHELRLSLMLPLFLFARRRCGSTVALAVATGISLAANAVVVRSPELFPAGFHGFRFDAERIASSLILTARFCLPFALGAVLATHAGRCRRVIRRPVSGLVALGTGAALLTAENEFAMALGAATLIAVAAWWRPMIATLRARPLLWLGRISYSLYLVHLPIMLVSVHAGRGCGPAWVWLLAGSALALPVAAVFTRMVEEPAIRWSRAAGRLVSPGACQPGGSRQAAPPAPESAETARLVRTA